MGPIDDKDVAAQISKLYDLHQSGALSKAEFENAKRRLLGTDVPRIVAQPPPRYNQSHAEVSKQDRFAGWKRTLVFLGVVIAVALIGSTFIDSNGTDSPAPTPATSRDVVTPTAITASLTLNEGSKSNTDTTIYVDGSIGVLVTIPDSANWSHEVTGCTGTGSGTAGDMHAGQLAAVTPVNSTSSSNTAFLSSGVMFDDGSCQFAFETNRFEADAYRVSVWNDEAVCQKNEVAALGETIIIEVIADQNGLTCKPYSD